MKKRLLTTLGALAAIAGLIALFAADTTDRDESLRVRVLYRLNRISIEFGENGLVSDVRAEMNRTIMVGDEVIRTEPFGDKRWTRNQLIAIDTIRSNFVMRVEQQASWTRSTWK